MTVVKNQPIRVVHYSAHAMSVLAVLLVVACMSLSLILPLAAFATDSDRVYHSWSEVAQRISNELAQGNKEYQAHNSALASTRFSSAYNSVYVASNLITVVRETYGQDQVQQHTDQFQRLQTLVYQPNQDEHIRQTITQLTSSLTGLTAQLDANTQVVAPKIYAQALRAQIQKERKQLDAKKKKNHGRAGRSWSQVAQEMNVILDKALDAYQSGNGARGADLINEAYYQYYEKLGFEKNVMNAISGSRVSTVEYQFKECRQSMNHDGKLNGERVDVKKLVSDLQKMLLQDAARLDGNAGGQTNGIMQFVTSSFGQAFIILLREGLEALLVVAAIITYLVKTGNRTMVKHIYAGLILGLAASGVVALLFSIFFNGSGPQQEITEGVVALIAAGMLLYTGNWMISHSSVQAWNRYIYTKTSTAVSKGSVFSLALLSFLAVFREGAETVIFYQAIFSVANGSQAYIWAGFACAAMVLILIFLAIRFASLRIPIRAFFGVTSMVMSVLVVVFAGGGVHALIEGDLIEGVYLPGLATNDWLGFYPYVETVVAQVIAALLVVVLLVASLLKQRKLARVAQLATFARQAIAQVEDNDENEKGAQA